MSLSGKNISPELAFSCLVGQFDGLRCGLCGFFCGLGNLLAGPKQERGSERQKNGETGDYNRANGDKKFVTSFNVADKTFPVVALFLILGPALGLMLAVFVSGWLGGGVLFGWLGLVLVLITLGVWT